MTAERDRVGAGEPSRESIPYAAAVRTKWPTSGVGGWTSLGPLVLWCLVLALPYQLLGVEGGLVPGALWSGWLAFWLWRTRTPDRAAAERRILIEEAARDGSPAWETDWVGRRDVLESSWWPGPVIPLRYAVPAGGAVLLANAAWMMGHEVIALALGGPVILAAIAAVAAAACRGRVQVRMDRFPLRVGGPVTLYVAVTARGSRLRDAEALLRCVTGRRVGRVVPHLTTLWSRIVVLPPGGSPGPDEFVSVAFDLPADAPGTFLHGERVVRWELLIAGRTPWGRMMETVVVPVYAARSATSG